MDRKFRSGILLSLLFAAFAAVRARAYELEAHQFMTVRAFDRSALADAGHGPLAALADDGGQIPSIQSSMPVGIARRWGLPRDLVGWGARFEDQPTLEGRFLNHFFDPQHGGRGLSIGALPPARSSPDWILEQPDAVSGQDFSLRDAHDHFYLALVARTREIRERNLGLLMEGIGRGVHHLQDMTQPAHVRNDPHPVGLDGDFFELNTENALSSDGGLPTATPYGTPGVNLETFDSARKFWQLDGRGLAEFTARNFVSMDTMFTTDGRQILAHPDFPLPAAVPCAGRSLIERRSAADSDLLGPIAGLGLELWFIATPIHDRYSSPDGAQSGCNPYSSTFSLFAGDLAARGLPSRLTLNPITWKAAREILLPRAVAYSAGLIDYFFRGRLAIESVLVEGAEAMLAVRNASGPGFALQDGLRGTTEAEFEVWYDALDGTRKPAGIREGGDLQGQEIGPGEAHAIRFVIPPDVDSRRQQPYVLVFRGTVGREEGVAGERFAPQRHALLVTPSYPGADGITGARALERMPFGWSIGPGPTVAGNVDWRGSRADDVLTWDGPQSRYWFAPSQAGGISRHIYRGGRRISDAPANVIGAAIRRTSGDAGLIVITYSGGTLEVHVRPLRADYPNDDAFDPQNPLGWRRLYSSAESAPESPAFFNASGTEAQLFLPGLVRLRLRLASSDVGIERIDSKGRGADEGTETATVRGQGCGGSSNNSETHKVVWERPTVVCADYRGDTELLCQIEAEGGAQASSSMTYEFDRSGFRQSESGGRTYSTRRLLVAGALRIPLSGEQRVQESSLTIAQFFDASAPVETTRNESSIVGHDTKVLYLDVRNDLAAFQENENRRSVVSSSNVALAGNQYVVEGTTSDGNETVSRLTAIVGGAAHVLSSEETAATPRVTTAVGPLQNRLTCRQLSDALWTNQWSTPIDDSSFRFDPFLHRIALDPTAGIGFAKDGGGNVVATVPIVRRDAYRADQVQSAWSYLSDGDLRTLFPGAPPGARYAPVGVIR